jgi:hypothetical protein
VFPAAWNLSMNVTFRCRACVRVSKDLECRGGTTACRVKYEGSRSFVPRESRLSYFSGHFIPIRTFVTRNFISHSRFLPSIPSYNTSKLITRRYIRSEVSFQKME